MVKFGTCLEGEGRSQWLATKIPRVLANSLAGLRTHWGDCGPINRLFAAFFVSKLTEIDVSVLAAFSPGSNFYTPRVLSHPHST